MRVRHPITAKGSSRGSAKGLMLRCRPGWFTRWMTALDAAWDSLVPYGYEDEAGFHYGVPPARLAS